MSELFGHEDAESLLIEGYESGKLAHGWLIAGSRGIGKATLAKHFAKRLLAGDDEAAAARMESGAHPDFLLIAPEFDTKKGEFAREISVEQAREIAQFLSLTPGESQWRVVIVDSVDALNVNGANAILKILEEPPPQAVLLLISHNPGKLLPTIRSRCRMLKLKPLNQENFTKAARRALPDVPYDRMEQLGRLSGFSPGLAAEFEGQGALGVYSQLCELLANAPAIDALMLHAFAEQIGTGTMHQNWRLLTQLMLRLIERATRFSADILDDPLCDEEPAALKALAKIHGAYGLALLWQQALEEFSLAEARHLDYKQVIITFMHGLCTTTSPRQSTM